MEIATWWQVWLAPLHAVWKDLAGFAPRLVAALVVIMAGLFLAWLGQALSYTLCRWLRLDAKLGNVWLFRLWSRGLRGQQPSGSISHFIYYVLLFLGVLLAVRLLGAGVADAVLTSLLGLVPRVFSVMLILFLGALMAMFFSVIAQLILASSNLQHPNFWGKVIAWGTFGVAIMFSLEQLGLVGKFLTQTGLILLGMAGLAAAIAFGLGCKDLAREFLIELLKNDKTPPAA
jgi:hypothetical protein